MQRRTEKEEKEEQKRQQDMLGGALPRRCGPAHSQHRGAPLSALDACVNAASIAASLRCPGLIPHAPHLYCLYRRLQAHHAGGGDGDCRELREKYEKAEDYEDDFM